MTQISRPQAGHQNSGYTDAGPYSADEWAELYKTLFTIDAANQGPLQGVLNELEVTNPSGASIQVDTGWGIVNGHLLKSSAATTFTATTPSANPRIDVVVMVENNTAVNRTAGIASGNDLIFPTSLTDYGGSASLKPFSARLAILKGTEAGSPSAPTLDADSATLFMVPLAQYQISTGGVVSALTDRREFAQFATAFLKTRRFFIAPPLVRNLTDGTTIHKGDDDGYSGVLFPDAKVCIATGHFTVPADFASGMTVQPVFEPNGTGNLAYEIGARYGAIGEGSGNHTATTGGTQVLAVTNGILAAPPALSLPDAAAGDIIGVTTYRQGTDVNDTVGAAVNMVGFIVEYTAGS